MEQGTHPDDARGSENSREEAKVAATSTSLSPVVQRVLAANRISEALQEWRTQAAEGNRKWKLKDGLLLYEGRLVVLEDGDLRARLLDKIHR